MKKLVVKITSCCLAISILFSLSTMPSYAENEIKVFLDNSEIAFDVPPQIIDDYTMVPMRAIFEALGYYVDWDNIYQVITAVDIKNDTSIIIDCGINSICVFRSGAFNKVMLNNGDVSEFYKKHTKQIEQKIPIINGRTLVPVRLISESSGCNVLWDENTKSVHITSNTNQQNGILFFDEFTCIPAPNARIEKKQPMQPEISGYNAYIYDYNNQELTSDKLAAYMKLLEEYDFYFDQNYANETGTILFSYNNDQSIITFSGNDTMTRIIVSDQKGKSDTYYNNKDSEPYINSFNQPQNHLGNTQSAPDLYVENDYLPNHGMDYDNESYNKAAYENELAQINAKYDAMISAVQSSSNTFSGSYGSSSTVTALAQQIQMYEQQREAEIEILNAKYGY